MTAGWLAGLRARADERPRAPRVDLVAGPADAAIGSIEPALAERMAAAGLPLVLRAPAWRIASSSLDAAFADIATWLRDAGIASAWRNELLSVDDAAGACVGAIERAAVRPLGITTHAVHLVGWAEQGGVWVQQRAFDKSTDPGLWDTLMGGLVSAGESIAQTLLRETWEEAGLRTDALHEVRTNGRLTVRRPVGNGYMVEHIHVHEAVVPAGLVPQNQDGEVAGFECLALDELERRLRAGAFTLEAALILADALALRNDTDSDPRGARV